MVSVESRYFTWPMNWIDVAAVGGYAVALHGDLGAAAAEPHVAARRSSWCPAGVSTTRALPVHVVDLEDALLTLSDRGTGARMCPAASRTDGTGGARHGLLSCPGSSIPFPRALAARLIGHDVPEVGIGAEAVTLQVLRTPLEGEPAVGGDLVAGVVVAEPLGGEPPPVGRDHDHVAVGLHGAVLPPIQTGLRRERRALGAFQVVERHLHVDADS